MMRVSTLVLILLLCTSCSTVSKRVVYEVSDLKNKAVNFRETGYSLLQSKEYEKAIDYFNGAMKYNTLADNIAGIIVTNGDLGNLYNSMGQPLNAIEYFNAAIVIYKNENIGRKEMAYIYHGLGDSYRLRKEYEKAEASYKEAIKIYREFDMKENAALVMLSMGRNLNSSVDEEAGVKYILAAVTELETLYAAKKLKKADSLSNGYFVAGNHYFRKGEYAECMKYIELALKLDKMNENSRGIADDYYIAGKVKYALNEKENALYLYEKSRDIYKTLNFSDDFIKLTGIIAGMYQESGEYKSAILNYGYIYNTETDERRKEDAQQHIKTNIETCVKLALLNEIQANEIKLKYGIK